MSLIVDVKQNTHKRHQRGEEENGVMEEQRLNKSRKKTLKYELWCKQGHESLGHCFITGVNNIIIVHPLEKQS